MDRGKDDPGRPRSWTVPARTRWPSSTAWIRAASPPPPLPRSYARGFHAPLPEQPSDPSTVIDDLARNAEGGLLGSAAGRFFGWVIGGTLPVAIAADWLAAAWDQNAASYALSPAEAVIEDVCGAWLKQLLGLPEGASFAFVTGCQMAHVTALAAARHRLLERRGIDVERAGLAGGPPIRVLLSENRHESLLRAVRLLGLGTDCVRSCRLRRERGDAHGCAGRCAARRTAPSR